MGTTISIFPKIRVTEFGFEYAGGQFFLEFCSSSHITVIDLCGFQRDLVWNVCLVFCLSHPLNDCHLRTVLRLGCGSAASRGGPFSLLAIGLGITRNPISFYFIGGETCWGCFWKLSRTAEGLRFYWTYKVEVSLSHVSNTLPENTRSPNSEAKTFMTDCSGRFKFLSVLLAP